MKVTDCRRCSGPVVWAITPNDKRMPLDPDPNVFRGNVVLLDPENDTPLCRVLRKGEDAVGQLRYVAHFNTCKANQARRAKAS